jgi:hypothetical protein
MEQNNEKTLHHRARSRVDERDGIGWQEPPRDCQGARRGTSHSDEAFGSVSTLSGSKAELRALNAYQRGALLDRRRAKAADKVSWAVEIGLLPRANTLMCVDCGKRAFCYDHRDYAKPLEVDPVCGRCNVLRGAGAPYTGYSICWQRNLERTTERLGEWTAWSVVFLRRQAPIIRALASQRHITRKLNVEKALVSVGA